MTIRLLPALLCLAMASPALAQLMTVSTFLTKAEALQKKGALALFSSDYGLLKKEISAAAASYRADRKARAASGLKPEVCPPQGGFGLDPKELTAAFRTIPAAQRETTNVKQGWIHFMKQKFPCPR